MLSSRKRVSTALEHEKPDRIPIDFWAVEAVKESLKRLLDIQKEEDLLKRLGVDIRRIDSRYIGPKERDSRKPKCGGYEDSIRKGQYDSYTNIFGIGFEEIEGKLVKELQLSFWPLRDVRDISQVEEYGWPSADWFDRSKIKSEIERLNSSGEYWIQYDQKGYQGVFETAWAMRGFEQFLMDLIVDPELACKIMDKIAEFQIEDILRTLEAAEDQIDMVYISDDLGGQDGMILSPQIWREYVRPREERIIKVIKDNYSSVRIMYHSCGSIIPVVKDLLEIGVDILNPLQLRAKGMNPGELKRRYGDRLCFHGGMDLQRILPYGTEREIRVEVKRLIDILGEQGGYIFGPSEFIQPDTSPGDILAMYEAAREYRYKK